MPEKTAGPIVAHQACFMMPQEAQLIFSTMELDGFRLFGIAVLLFENTIQSRKTSLDSSQA